MQVVRLSQERLFRSAFQTVLRPFENCTLKSLLANILRRRDKLFICPNNVCAPVEKADDTYTTAGPNTTAVDEYETADVTFVVMALKGEKENERGWNDGTGNRGWDGIKRRKTFAGCTLRGGCRAQGESDELVARGLAGETDDSTRGWHLNGDVLYVEPRRQDDSSSKAASVSKTERQKLLKGKSIRRYSLLFP